MKQIFGRTKKASAEATLNDIRRVRRRQFFAEGKIRIVLQGPLGRTPARPTRRGSPAVHAWLGSSPAQAAARRA
jgi:hypothetical protein